MSHPHSMGFSASPPTSPVRSLYYSHYFKSTGKLFRKYPLPKDASKSKPQSSTASSSRSRKDKSPAHYKPSFYAKLIDAIAYFDTGSHTTMMNPAILPLDSWKPHTRYFNAADGQIFTTNLISKSKVGIKLFPSYTVWAQVLGTPLPDKDILIGWDVYCQCNSLRILPSGVRYKRDFKPFSPIHKVFPLSALQPPFQDIQQKLLQFCTNSHAEFHHHSPLWKNSDFFVHLIFKLNEDYALCLPLLEDPAHQNDDIDPLAQDPYQSLVCLIAFVSRPG
ncbi:hypothetical protein Dsin_029997 [Dipteronia sinensis]|uniref:Uncharacterized protein n=1 Tax=Dipteronia sinensis TaxID=43782 RepID=A0AAD9ZIC4_9ROSI|nr:hypothetical protein Dsin_029997 [Dipteronia sinensis]